MRPLPSHDHDHRIDHRIELLFTSPRRASPCTFGADHLLLARLPPWLAAVELNLAKMCKDRVYVFQYRKKIQSIPRTFWKVSIETEMEENKNG